MLISVKRILVVDDEPLVCDSMRRMLVIDGHVVETAFSGKAALELMEKGKFDPVFVDYVMPGMNGDELAAAIKALDPSQPIVMVTAYAETLAASGTSLAGIDSVISKPFDLQEVRKAVAELLLNNGGTPNQS